MEKKLRKEVQRKAFKVFILEQSSLKIEKNISSLYVTLQVIRVDK